MATINRILAKVTRIKGTIKNDYSALNEEQLQQIEDELIMCSTRIHKIVWK